MKDLYTYCLRIADNSLILSHRLGEYSSHGPFLEEDLALTNVGLDLLGQAEGWLRYAAEIDGSGKTEDDLAYRRFENEYYNVKLTEQPNTDFAYLTVRQFFMDVFNYYLYTGLEQSKDERLKALAQKSLKEVRYHLRRSSEWIIRLGQGTEESKRRATQAVTDLWKFVGELFEVDEVEKNLTVEGISPNLEWVEHQWFAKVKEIFTMAGLDVPESDAFLTGRLEGYHTEHLGYLLAEMQNLHRLYPNAKW